MRLHDVIDQLPIYFQKRYEETKDCGCKNCDTITYRLTVEFEEYASMYGDPYRQYRIYYKPEHHKTFASNPPVIGDKCEKRIEGKNFQENLRKLKELLVDNDVQYE